MAAYQCYKEFHDFPRCNWESVQVGGGHEMIVASWHYSDLHNSTTSLLRLSQNNQVNSGSLERELTAAQEHLSGLAHHFRDFYNPLYFNIRRRDDSTIAKRVFGLPELAEHILHRLNILDTLAMTRISRSLRDIINGSISLQHKLSLVPDTSRTEVYYPFGSDNDRLQLGGGTRFWCSAEPTDSFPEHHEYPCEPGWALMRAGFRPFIANTKIEQIYRRMYICQPPHQEMQVILVAKGLPVTDGKISPPPPIRASPGLTVGDLYDCSNRLTKEHGHAYTRFAVRFQGKVLLQQN